ncbi:MAG: hypothetical protein IT287_04250, partial [Bdellovibrionaceae bacterium]|nr:hypothetical protein [Pseudobdellovibrionaceae bacterium]
MFKKALIALFLTAPAIATAVTEQEFLDMNVTYTNSLIDFLENEPKILKKISESKTQKTQLEKDVKAQTKALDKIVQDITKSEAQLVNYKSKLANKAQIEVDLVNEKQSNTKKINHLDSQISTNENSLNSVESGIALLENEKQGFISKINTQEQIKQFSQNQISQLENEIENLEDDKQ